MRKFAIVSMLTLTLSAACGGCGEDQSPDETPENNEVEPWVAETCADTADTDKDGRAGCDDPDCRLDSACEFEPPDPTSMQVAIPAVGVTSFYDRMAFLVGPNSVQRGAKADVFKDIPIGATSGMVRDPSGTPIVGAAVTAVGYADYGRTYSRTDGRFDFLLGSWCFLARS